MPKRLISILSLMVVWLGLNQLVALASDFYCKTLTQNEASGMAHVVFAGKVVVANQQAWRVNRIRFEPRPPFLHLTKDNDRYRTTLDVATVWKGKLFAKTSVIHSLDGWGTGYSFREGEEYIVYAVWFEGELYASGGCLRINKLNAASEDLAALGVGNSPAPNPSSLAGNIGKLMAVFLLLLSLGWAAWQARRKYGIQKI